MREIAERNGVSIDILRPVTLAMTNVYPRPVQAGDRIPTV
jgi:hypothetical protein